MTGCFFHFRNSYSGDRKSRHFTFILEWWLFLFPEATATIRNVNAMSRETILRQYLDTLKGQYSHILIDCQPSLGMLTVNALAAANRIIIPVQAEYLPAKGLEQLLSTVNKVKRQINPKLQIDEFLLFSCNQPICAI